MSLEQPSMEAGYLHQVLVNGVTPFRYRSNVRSLLGMSDNDVNPPPAGANLPPIEFFYATGRSPSMMAHSALIEREDQNVANTASVDGENSPTLDPLDRPPSPLVEPNIQTSLPTLLTSSAQRLSPQKPELTQEQPISSGIERTFPSAIEVIASATTAELPTRGNRSDTALENPPIAITIPSVSDHPLPSINHRRTIPKSPQSNELGNAVDSGVEPNDQMNNRLMDITVMPSHISDRDAEVADVLRPAPSRLNPRSLLSGSPQSLSNLGVITSTQYPQSIPLEPNIDAPAVSPSPVSFRPKARTDANTRSDERLIAQDTPVLTPIPMSQGNPHALLPIATTAMPIASASTLPNRSAISSQPASRVTEEITKLRSMVAELTAQVVAQQEFQLSAAPIVLPPSVPIIERSMSSTKPPKAFWERSYMSRLYRWSRR